MEFVVLLVGVAVWGLLMYFGHQEQESAHHYAAPTAETFAPTHSTDERKRFLPPMPTGHQIYADRLSIAGIRFRKKDAIRFAKASRQSLRFERQPANEHDPNAIKVIGITPEGEHFLGYVWSALAAQIVETNLYDQVRPRLMSIYFQDEYVDVEYQVVGPRSEKGWFDDHDEPRANEPQPLTHSSGGR